MESLIYIRKLNAQELGFRMGESKKAGRYVLISKKCMDYFPKLSEVITNDHIAIYLIPPNSDNGVLANFVYHNSKISDGVVGGRDEFRIYLNSENDPGGNYFKPDDIIIFHRQKIAVVSEDEADVYAYKIYHFPVEHGGEKYAKIKKLLHGGKIASAHALVPVSSVPFIDFPDSVEIKNRIVPEDVKKFAFDIPTIESTEPVRNEFSRIMRSNSFRDIVLFFYDYQCAINQTAIKYEDKINIHAAHIVPKYARGGDNPTNGIALNRDLHWAFDKGFFTLEADYKVLVHPKAKMIEQIAALNHRQIFLPRDDRARPNSDCLKWHKENVFGIFAK